MKSAQSKVSMIEERLALMNNLGYKAINQIISKQTDLTHLEKVAVLMEDELKGFKKQADKVEEFTKTHAEYWISSAVMYGLKNYAFNYGKMFAPEIGVAVGAIVGFQLLTNPEFVFGTLGSVWNGITSTVGNYTSYVSKAVYSNTTVLANSIDNIKNGTLSIPINKNNTAIAVEAITPKQDSLDKYVDMSVKLNASEPTYITHEGLHFLVTPFTMGDHSM